jgi:hypothetical protein
MAMSGEAAKLAEIFSLEMARASSKTGQKLYAFPA